MKKLILAAALIAPLSAAPAFAQQDAAGFIETPAVTTTAPNQLREFSARAHHVPASGQVLINRDAVPSSAFPTNN
ncbi:hypothetical protein BN1110_03001 [bacterium YEK0313]|nr:hypothetical protein BN1110_03001 [bacterium YEK0313]